MISVVAPAKINLTLEVLRRRDDGYHDIRSAIQTISLCDRLVFEAGSELGFSCDLDGWDAGESLVSRAAQLLRRYSGVSYGATVKMKKEVPLLSGLGGDSSDAAATLRGLNKLWGLNLPKWRLAELAAELGSDVPFFIFGGTAIIEGRGEVIVPLPSLPPMWVVLLMPQVARGKGKTGSMYGELKKSRFTDGCISDELMETITARKKIIPSQLYNVFEAVALKSFRGLEKYRWHFLEAGAFQVSLAGSGPALYSLLEDRKPAREIYSNLKKKGFEVYLAETVGPSAATRLDII